MVSFNWKFCSYLFQELLFLFSWFCTCFFVVLFEGHQICTGKDSKKIISYLTSSFYIWLYGAQSHPHFNNLFCGQRCLTHSVMPLHCPFWFLWKKQNCTHISRCGKAIGLCGGIMMFSWGNSSMQFTFLMAAGCWGAISWICLLHPEDITCELHWSAQSLDVPSSSGILLWVSGQPSCDVSE